MRILFAAKDGFRYNRTHILAEGLRELGHDVQFYKIPERRSKYGAELRDLSLKNDFVYVPPFRHRDLSFVKSYSKVPVVFDPLISRYLTKVVDYGHYWKAPQKWWIDYRDFRNCDLLLADTQAHLDYFKKTLLLPGRLKTAVVPVGVHSEEFQAQYPQSSGPLKVGFYGTFVPLQGVSTIIAALALLKDEPDLNFRLLGTGHQYESARQQAQKAGLSLDLFKGWIAYENLAQEVQAFDLGLGVFGQSKKTDLVIPNKLYHYAAAGKAIISKENNTVSEVFSPDTEISLVEANAQLLAERILHFRDHRNELIAIGKAARAKIEAHYNHRAIAQKLINALESL